MRRREFADRILCGAGLPRVARRGLGDRLAVLMYHGIEPYPLSVRCSYVIDVAAFRRQLDYLDRHFTVLALEDALERLADGTLPHRAVTLTFDDGTRNLASCAAPELRHRGMPAAFFLTTGGIGSDVPLWPDRLWLAFAHSRLSEIDLSTAGLGPRTLFSSNERADACEEVVARLKELPDAERMAQVESLTAELGAPDDAGGSGPFAMLSWPEVHDLSAAGDLTMYPHSVTHPILSRCTDEKVRYEIDESCAVLERQTGTAPNVFAYPNGRARDFDGRAIAALRERGVPWSLGTTFGFADRDCDPLALPRIPITSDVSFARFRLLVSGALGTPAGPSRRPMQSASASPIAG